MYTAGVDEAGRGPLAGPVYAAAVILDPDKTIDGLRDSKQLSELQRELLYDEICQHSLSYAIAFCTVEEIDHLNILQASLLAMRRAVMSLAMQPQLVLVDGSHCPDLPYNMRAIVQGDTSEQSISAASILAKVARDREMLKLHDQFPHYGFNQHKGYSTKKHLQALNSYGVSTVHRKSFLPVKALIDA